MIPAIAAMINMINRTNRIMRCFFLLRRIRARSAGVLCLLGGWLSDGLPDERLSDGLLPCDFPYVLRFSYVRLLLPLSSMLHLLQVTL